MDTPAPLYERVKAHITEGIVAGLYKPGARLPSEAELVERLQVSRMTVNRAFRELMRDGVIVRMQGVGSFVCEAKPVTSLADIRDIRSIVAARGKRHRCTVRAACETTADPDTARLFEAAPGEPLHLVTLLHYEDDCPLQLERRYVSRAFAPDLLEHDFALVSLPATLTAIAPISELEHVVEAALADGQEAAELALSEAAPVLRVRRRTWVGARVVTVGFFSHPADRYRVAVRLKPADLGLPELRP